MKPQEIIRRRMSNQQLAKSKFKKPEDVVAWFGAMQAQDYPGALWGVALRTPATTASDVERAIAERKIVRSWPMRGTLHFIPGADARWMLELLTPRINDSGGWETRRKFLGLEESDIKKGSRLISRALESAKILTRQELYDVLDRGGVSPAKQRGLHILSKLAHEMLICFGPHKGKQATFVLLDEWLSGAKRMDREASLAELAKRYFTSHGPATIHDFAWWSGLKVSDARRGLDAIASELEQETFEKTTYWMPRSGSRVSVPSPDAHLLPAYDEYLVAYRDRSAAVELDHAPKVFASTNGIFSPVLVIDGKVVGTWGRLAKKTKTVVSIKPFGKLTWSQKDVIARRVRRFGDFLGMETELVL